MKVFRVVLAMLCCGGAASAAGGADWMARLDDTVTLAALSIPGTHNSIARFEPLAGTAKCQDLRIPAQLEAGVRFLDLRCRHLNDAFRMHHGAVDQRVDFSTVQDQLLAFLREHPGETVIASIAETHAAEGATRSFEETFLEETGGARAQWWLKPAWPTLGEARGKIVLFRRFAAEGAAGIDATAWRNNATFGDGRMRVQDRYRVADAGEKWAQVEAMLAEAREGDPAVPVINFASGYVPRAFGIPDIRAVADPVNAKVSDFLARHPQGRTGVVLFDFITPELARAVYQTNRFREAGPPDGP